VASQKLAGTPIPATRPAFASAGQDTGRSAIATISSTGACKAKAA
jgi:hypothetical protein